MIRGLHLPLFLLAVVCAVGVKIAVNEERQLTETTISATINYRLPTGVELIEPVKQIEVRLRGELREIANLNSLSLGVDVTIREGELGAVDITDERLVVRGPADFEVVSKNPNFFRLTVEKSVTRMLPVRVVLTDEPAAGALPGTPEVVPGQIVISGPSSRVTAQRDFEVRVSLGGHAFDFSETVPLAPPPDSLIRVLEPRQVVVSVPLKVPGSPEDTADDAADDDAEEP